MFRYTFIALARFFSFGFALNAFTNTAGWLAAGYGYFAVVTTLGGRPFQVDLFTTTLLASLVVVTIISFCQFGMLSRLGLYGVGRNTRLMNKHLPVYDASELPSDILPSLYHATRRIPVHQFRSGLSYALAVLAFVVPYYYWRTGELFQSGVILFGGAVATAILSYLAYGITEQVSHGTRVRLAEELARRKIDFAVQPVLSLTWKFVLLLGVIVLNMVLLTFYLTVKTTLNIPELLVFAALTILTTALLLFLFQRSIKHGLQMIIQTAHSLASGHLVRLPASNLDREFVSFAESFNRISAEAHRVRRELINAERKYRYLFEGATDIVLGLDHELNVSNSNKAVRELLGLRKKHVVGRRLIDLIAFANPMEEALAEAELRACIAGTLEFERVVPMRTWDGATRAMRLRLERIEMESNVELIARARPSERDPLAARIQSEQATYILGNDVNQIAIMADRLTHGLTNELDDDELLGLRLGLREMMANAIEHGNLGITYAEKTEALRENGYLELIATRRGQAEYRGRQIRIEYKLTPEAVEYLIKDDGDGFDHEAFTKASIDEIDADSLHGRGIVMTRDQFDQVEYNEKGNEVRLLRRRERALAPS